MRPPAPPPLVTIALSMLLASSSPAFAQAPAPYVCMTRDFSKRVGYVSPVFKVAPAEATKVNPAWNAVMTSQYGITALPYLSCQGPYPSDAVADSARAAFIANLRNTMKQQVNELSWTYGGAPAVKVAAPPPPAPTPSPPAPATLTGEARQAAQAGVASSKGYCTQNLKGLFDCDCFAQAVLKHRLAHPEEWKTDRDGTRWVPDHDLHVGIPFRLDCTECLEDARLTAWARKTVSDGFGQQLMSKLITQAQVDRFSDCAAKGFVTHYRANPYLDKYEAALNEARIGCGNPRG